MAPIIPILIIIGLSLVGVIGDFFIKLAGNSRQYIRPHWLIIGLLIYASTAIGWFFVMKHIKLSTLGAYYGIFTVLFLLLVGIFIFHEKLNLMEGIGIALAITSFVLLSRFA